MRLSGKWTQHLKTPEERSKLVDLIVADTVVLGRLLEIIEEFEEELDQNESSKEEYNSPAFPYLKADRIGERRAYKKIKSLLQIKD